MAGAKAVALITRAAANATPTVGTYAETYYLHADHLGSTDVITKGGGVVHVRTSFDAWGQRRSGTWSGAPSGADQVAIARSTHRGYTGHEQLDNLNLVHMNGRVYDPVIARFMSADPIIQDPYHSQAFNRYSYIWNNPLNGTDPTGFCTEGIATRIKCDPRVSDSKVASVAKDGQAPAQEVPPSTVPAEPGNKTGQQTADKGGKETDSSSFLQTLTSIVGNGGTPNQVEAMSNVEFTSSVNGQAFAGAGIPPAALGGAVLASTAFGVVLKSKISQGLFVWTKSALNQLSGRKPSSTSIGFHATLPEVVPLIKQEGFKRGTAPGRLGSGGTYVNNTREGAIAEFQFRNPGTVPAILTVNYRPGVNVTLPVAPPDYVMRLPLGNVDSITAPSLRAPGTFNTNVLNGSVGIRE
jgi:RHS repeat-associated protein